MDKKQGKYKRFCLRGHDTWIYGRRKNRRCRECTRLDEIKRWKNLPEIQRLKHQTRNRILMIKKRSLNGDRI